MVSSKVNKDSTFLVCGVGYEFSEFREIYSRLSKRFSFSNRIAANRKRECIQKIGNLEEKELNRIFYDSIWLDNYIQYFNNTTSWRFVKGKWIELETFKLEESIKVVLSIIWKKRQPKSYYDEEFVNLKRLTSGYNNPLRQTKIYDVLDLMGIIDEYYPRARSPGLIKSVNLGMVNGEVIDITGIQSDSCNCIKGGVG